MIQRTFLSVIRRISSSLYFARGVRGRPYPNVIAEARQSAASGGLLSDLNKPDNSVQLAEMLKGSGSFETGLKGIAALAHLSQLQKSEMVHEQSLRLVCNHIVRFARFLDLDGLIRGLKHLSQLKVTSQSVVMQTILQLIRKNVNVLNFSQLFFLNFLLKEVSQTSLVISLRSSLPLVVRNHLDMQMNRTDLSKLLSLFEFCSKHRFHVKDLVKVSSAIERHFPLQLEGALVILWAVPSLGTELDPFQKLIQHSLKVVSKNVAEIDVRGVLKLLERLLGRGFYSERLLSAVSSRAVNEHWTLISIHSLLKLFSKFAFVDLNLLYEYFRQISNEIQSVEILFNEVVSNFAVANYSPSGIGVVLEQLFRRQEIKTMNDREVLKLGLDLEILKVNLDVGVDLILCDEHRMLELVQCCQETNDWESYKMILQLASRKKLPMSKESSSLVLNLLSDHLRGNIQSTDINMYAALKQAIGNERHQIYNGILSRSGVFVDHLTVFSSDPIIRGYKEDDITIFEELIQNIDGADLMVILLRDCKHYAINCDHILGPSAFESNILRTQRLNVLEISLPQWNGMPERERLPFLAQRIKEIRTDRI